MIAPDAIVNTAMIAASPGPNSHRRADVIRSFRRSLAWEEQEHAQRADRDRMSRSKRRPFAGTIHDHESTREHREVELVLRATIISQNPPLPSAASRPAATHTAGAE
jgi:hypothetical protein